MKKKSNRGGKRVAGPGKKIGRPTGSGQKIQYSTKLEPWFVFYLRDCENAAVTIENAIERSPGYKRWEASGEAGE